MTEITPHFSFAAPEDGLLKRRAIRFIEKLTGQPEFGKITVRFEPAPGASEGVCVELRSLKLYLRSYRKEGSYYEAVTDRIRDDLAALMKPTWLQVITDWRGRGGIRSRITATHGEVPAHYLGR